MEEDLLEEGEEIFLEDLGVLFLLLVDDLGKLGHCLVLE